MNLISTSYSYTIPREKIELTHNKHENKRTEESFWESIRDMKIGTFLEDWISQYDITTRKNYRSYLKTMISLDFLAPGQSIDSFRFNPHEKILDEIKRMDGLGEGSKQLRASMYCSFTGYLERLTHGKVRKAIPAKHGANKTFYRVRHKVATPNLVQKEWQQVFDELEKINPRDCLIAKMLLHAGKRINEVLSLETSQIDWESRTIAFVQSKTQGTYVETFITFPKGFMTQIKEYIGNRSGIVFVTTKGAPLHSTQISRNLKLVHTRLKWPLDKQLSPHVFRTSLITYLREQGFPDHEIMKVTGHRSSEMVSMYDKSSLKENPSQNIQLWPE